MGQLWRSGTAQKLVDNLPQLSLDVKPDGSEMIYFSDMQIFKRNHFLAVNSAYSL